MPNREFVATKGLLHDDMRKQAGRIEKSWLEAIMNAVDAGATEFHIDITAEETIMRDNGSGMDEEDIEKYFRQFGYKDSDVEEKTFGKFRRGRGQIFNFGRNVWRTQNNILVVDLDSDSTEVYTNLDESKTDSDIERVADGEEPGFATYKFNTEGLGFNRQTTNTHIDGTEINVKHYKEIEDPDSKIEEFKKLAKYVSWLHDIDVYVNQEPVDSKFRSDFETEYAFYQYGDSQMFADASTYNLGAYVSNFKIEDSSGKRVPIAGIIVTKEELDLNNARTEIIEGDETWKQIKEDYVVGARYKLAQKSKLTDKESKWLISQASQDSEVFGMIKDRDIVSDINGNSVSITDLMQEDFAFAPENNAVAQEAMSRKDILMIDDKFEDSIRTLSSESRETDEDMPEVPEGRSYEQVVDEEMQFEMKEWNESKLSKRRKENLDKIRWFIRELGCYDEVKPGHSKHEDAWRIDTNTILVDKEFLNANKMKFANEVLDKVVSIAAAPEDTRGGFTKNTSYYRNYHRYMSKASEPRQTILSGNVDLNSVPSLRQ